MKTFKDLIAEVQEKGRCHRCGGCVTFCETVNYGALEADPEGTPRFKDEKKCIECGLCYMICPVIDELADELKDLTGWREPIGAVLEIKTARSRDPEVLNRATDGGVITALLLYLRERGHIDGAVVSRKTGLFNRQPFLARSREEILEAAGFHFDTLPGTGLFPGVYSTYSPSVLTFKEVQERKRQVKKVAFVGPPCQIDTMRRMQVLGIVPSDTVRCYFGLFCSGNFIFGEEERRHLERLGRFDWATVRKVNIKEDLLIHLSDGQVRRLPLEELDFMKRTACFFCRDYSAEYADLSFGGLASEEGWTTVVVRNEWGRLLMKEALIASIEEPKGLSPQFPDEALEKILEWSRRKKERAENRGKVGPLS